MDDTLPLRSRALQFLRELRGWTQQKLAGAFGVSRNMIRSWEQGTRIPSPEKLHELARVMGHTEATLREVLRLLSPPVVPHERWIGPVHFTAEQEREMVDFCDESGRLVAFSLTQSVRRGLIQDAVDRERGRAQVLRAALVAERSLQAAVQRKPEYQTWAVAVLLCEESIRAASYNPQRALELAEAAVVAAEVAPGEERWRLRVQGYAQAHLGNALRVIGKKGKAVEIFGRRVFWEVGREADPAGVLNEARVYGLEASLLREQGLLDDALDLLDKALAVSTSSEKAYLLLGKSKVLRSAERYGEAISALQEAAAYIDHGNARLKCTQRFELANNLCELHRFEEVAILLPEVNGLAYQLGGKQLDLVRLKWLRGRVFAGIGCLEQAAETLSAVRAEFEAERLFYEATLVSVDLAAVLLRLQRTAPLKALARRMAAPFNGRVEAQETILSFQQAVEDEIATAELAESVRRHLLRAWGDLD